jgi:hypothetical protein
MFWFLSPSFVIYQTRTWGIGDSILLVMVLVFFFLPSFILFIFYLVPWCSLLVSLLFICYLTNKDLGHREFHFIGQGT